MTMQVDLPDELAGALACDEDEYCETPEQVVARIQALPRNPDALIPAQGSLADALRRTLTNEGFDLEEWNQEWATVEAEIRNMTILDDIRDGRL